MGKVIWKLFTVRPSKIMNVSVRHFGGLNFLIGRMAKVRVRIYPIAWFARQIVPVSYVNGASEGLQAQCTRLIVPFLELCGYPMS